MRLHIFASMVGVVDVAKYAQRWKGSEMPKKAILNRVNNLEEEKHRGCILWVENGWQAHCICGWKSRKPIYHYVAKNKLMEHYDGDTIKNIMEKYFQELEDYNEQTGN